ITIIGLLLFPLLLGGFSLYYQMALMEYLDNKKTIWGSFGYSWTLLGIKFWAAIASAGIFYLMAYVLQNVIALIPYVFGMLSLFTEVKEGSANDPQEVGASVMVLVLIVFFVTFFVSTILNVIVQLNQGIIFYGLKEDKENINTKTVIDQIGTGE
ncbi:MAG: hypothetical protein AAF901_14005, partial [Bacteroidota bacterium]